MATCTNNPLFLDRVSRTQYRHEHSTLIGEVLDYIAPYSLQVTYEFLMCFDLHVELFLKLGDIMAFASKFDCILVEITL
jgi:hypothetical protein